jgi:hypothetical protein
MPSRFIQPLEARRLLAGVHPTSYFIDGNYDSHIDAVGADAEGNIIITGTTDGIDVDLRDATTRYVRPAAASTWDPFVAKIAPGGQCLWAFALDSAEMGENLVNFDAVTTDSAGNVFLAGSLKGTIDFDSGAASRPLTAPAGVIAGVVLKLTSDGAYSYAVRSGIGTPGQFFYPAVAVDRFGCAYLATRENAAGVTTISKLSPTGRRAWVARVSSSSPAHALAIDNNDRAVLATGGGTLDLFTFNGRGKLLGGSGVASAYTAGGGAAGTIAPVSVDFDADNHLLVTGSFTHAFDFAPGKKNVHVVGPKHDSPWSNVFVAKYSSAGGLAFAFALGGASQDNAAGAIFDRVSGDVVLGGEFSGIVDLDPSAGGRAVVDSGDHWTIPDAESDLFVARYSARGRYRSSQVFATPKRDVLARGAPLIEAGRIVVVSNNYTPETERRDMHLFLPTLG